MKPRKKLIEEAKSDGTLDKCDRLISAAFLFFVIAQDFYDEAGEKLLKHKLLLGEDKKQFNKSIEEMSKYTRDFSQTFLDGREGGRLFNEEWGLYKDKILKLLELEEDYK